jgi:hypothetical protein
MVAYFCWLTGDYFETRECSGVVPCPDSPTVDIDGWKSGSRPLDIFNIRQTTGKWFISLKAKISKDCALIKGRHPDLKWFFWGSCYYFTYLLKQHAHVNFHENFGNVFKSKILWDEQIKQFPYCNGYLQSKKITK